MDFDNMNTRTVFREPRGMSRWVQLLFSVIAFATVTGFYTEIAVDVTCPATPPAPVTPTPPASSTTAGPPVVNEAGKNFTEKLAIQYPFSLEGVTLTNPCNTTTPPASDKHFMFKPVSGLTGSPQFFVMVGVLSLMYSFTTIVGYLMFSHYYESIPLLPLLDMCATVALCLLWFIASCSFASGVSFLKHTLTFPAIQSSFCPENLFTGACTLATGPVWRSLNIALIAGFTSVFLWASGVWFVFKETTLHVPRDQFRQTLP